MREIKFRIWDSQKTRHTILNFRYTGWVNITEETNGGIDQYTGLKDKNGKEIYEGDILRRDDDAIGVVEWHNKEAGFVSRGIKIPSGSAGYYEQSQEEIIGNIYENPTLLNNNQPK